MYFWLEQTTAASICTEQIEPGQARSAVAEVHESKESDKIKCNLSKSTKSAAETLLDSKREVTEMCNQAAGGKDWHVGSFQLVTQGKPLSEFDL